MENAVDQEFACEDCGFTSPVPNEVCPNCNGRITALNAPSKPKATSDGDDDDNSDFEGSGTEDVKELSLERLKEEESADDPSEMDYGDGDE